MTAPTLPPKRRAHKKRPSEVGVPHWLAALGLLLVAEPASAASAHQVSDFLADGYAVADKQTENQWLAGARPYEHLRRLVHVTTYRLTRKGSASITCATRCDSQRDNIETQCQQ
jgi:hypothetical protein